MGTQLQYHRSKSIVLCVSHSRFNVEQYHGSASRWIVVLGDAHLPGRRIQFQCVDAGGWCAVIRVATQNTVTANTSQFSYCIGYEYNIHLCMGAAGMARRDVSRRVEMAIVTCLMKFFILQIHLRVGRNHFGHNKPEHAT